MVLGKRWLFSIGNGAENQPLEMGRKSPDFTPFIGNRKTKTRALFIYIWYISFKITTNRYYLQHDPTSRETLPPRL